MIGKWVGITARTSRREPTEIPPSAYCFPAIIAGYCLVSPPDARHDMTETTETSSSPRAAAEHPAARVAAEIAAGDALTLSQAARERPAHRGKRAWGSTIWRNVTKGIVRWDGQRIRLEAARIGGRWLTSRAALARFLAALTPVFDEHASALQKQPGGDDRRPATANEVLEKMGY